MTQQQTQNTTDHPEASATRVPHQHGTNWVFDQAADTVQHVNITHPQVSANQLVVHQPQQQPIAAQQASASQLKVQ